MPVVAPVVEEHVTVNVTFCFTPLASVYSPRVAAFFDDGHELDDPEMRVSFHTEDGASHHTLTCEQSLTVYLPCLTGVQVSRK